MEFYGFLPAPKGATNSCPWFALVPLTAVLWCVLPELLALSMRQEGASIGCPWLAVLLITAVAFVYAGMLFLSFRTAAQPECERGDDVDGVRQGIPAG